jgi:CheY-like chemotaxis protein
MRSNSRTVRIFIVEDNAPDVFLIKEALALNGLTAQMHRCEDGTEAIAELASLQNSEFADIIILDLNLPGITGFEVLKYVRSVSQFDHIPLLILTSSHSPRDRAEAERLGANAFVTKPPTLPEFTSVVGSAIAKLLQHRPPTACTHRAQLYRFCARSGRRSRRIRIGSGNRRRRRSCCFCQAGLVLVP